MLGARIEEHKRAAALAPPKASWFMTVSREPGAQEPHTQAQRRVRTQPGCAQVVRWVALVVFGLRVRMGPGRGPGASVLRTSGAGSVRGDMSAQVVDRNRGEGSGLNQGGQKMLGLPYSTAFSLFLGITLQPPFPGDPLICGKDSWRQRGVCLGTLLIWSIDCHLLKRTLPRWASWERETDWSALQGGVLAPPPRHFLNTSPVQLCQHKDF